MIKRVKRRVRKWLLLKYKMHIGYTTGYEPIVFYLSRDDD